MTPSPSAHVPFISARLSVRLLALTLILSAVLSLCSCSSADNGGKYDGVDIDLTALSSTVQYAEITDMLTNPQNYIGKTVKLAGNYNASYFDETGKFYHYVLVTDTLACCQQGLEFVWQGEHSYPDDYPADASAVVITGVFDSYSELGITYYAIFTDAIAVSDNVCRAAEHGGAKQSPNAS